MSEHNSLDHSLPDDSRTVAGMDPRAFARFDHWMDFQLARLVKQWKHTAAPNAVRGAAVARLSPTRRQSSD